MAWVTRPGRRISHKLPSSARSATRYTNAASSRPGRCTAPGQTPGTRTIATPAGVVRAAARATAAGLTGGGMPARLGGRVGRRPLLGNPVGYPARPGLCVLQQGPSGARGGLARQVMAGAATGHSAPPPRVPRGNPVCYPGAPGLCAVHRDPSDGGPPGGHGMARGGRRPPRRPRPGLLGPRSPLGGIRSLPGCAGIMHGGLARPIAGRGWPRLRSAARSRLRSQQSQRSARPHRYARQWRASAARPADRQARGWAVRKQPHRMIIMTGQLT